MKKYLAAMLVSGIMMLPFYALSEGMVLMVELPEDAQMVENIAFEDGDFIQTYQLNEGVKVQILRYESLGMTLEEMAYGEWAGYKHSEKMAITEIDGYPAEGIRLEYEEEGNKLTVYLLMMDVQGQKLIFQAMFGGEMDAQQMDESMNAWINTMTIHNPEEMEVG